MRALGRLLAPALVLVTLFAPARALATTSAPASSAESTPQASDASDLAAAAYRAGDYATARDLWLGQLEGGGARGAERGRLCFNLGNAAYRAGDARRAVGWYTAALRHRPRDLDAWANLEHARSTAGLEPADRGDLSATIVRLLSAWTLAESERAVLAACAAWALLLAGEALRGGRLWRRLSLAGLALVAVILAPWIYNLVQAGRDPMLVVAERSVPVRSEPRAGAAQIATAESGAVVERVDELPEWVAVRVAGGAEGWVEREAVFALDR